MATVVSGILRAALGIGGKSLNILSFPTHEAYQSGFAGDGNSWYLWQQPGFKSWNRIFRPLPPNHTLLDPSKGSNQLPPDVAFDLVLSQNRLGTPMSQFTVAAGVARSLQIPHVALEHTLPHPRWSTGQLRRLRELEGDINVFIGDYQRKSWGWDDADAVVIEHGIDTGFFRPPPDGAYRSPRLLSVVNDWMNRDVFCGFHFWQSATEGLPILPVGDTPGLSSPARTMDELLWVYQTSGIFANTSLVSPVPTALLEAMSCGCGVVSTATCMIPDIVEDGVSGYCTSDPRVFRSICERLLEDPGECRRVGDAARGVVESRFGLDRFVADWRRVFGRAIDG